MTAADVPDEPVPSVAANGETGQPDKPAIPRWEVALVAAVAAASAIVVSVQASRLWFHSDAWNFLTRHLLTSPGSLLDPHARHWTTPTRVLYRLLFGAFGLDYWPWYFLPRAIGFAVVVSLVWYLLRRRGTDPVLAFSAFVVLLFLGVSGWQNASTFGNLIAISCLTFIAPLVAATRTPSRRQVVALTALLALAVASTTLGLAILAGTTAAILITGRIRAWWPALTVPAVMYGAWYVTFNGEGGSTVSISGVDVAEVPSNVYTVLETALIRVFDRPEPWGPFLVAALVLVVVILMLRRRLTVYELIFLGTLGAFVSMIIIARVSTGLSQVTATRYSHNALFLLIPALLPQVKQLPNLATKLAVGGLAAWLALMNFQQLDEALEFWENRSQASREVVETGSSLVAAGEPATTTARIDPPRSGQLSVAKVEELLDAGWEPQPSNDPEIVAKARGHLRMVVFRGGGPLWTAPITSHPVDGGCLVAAADETIEVQVVDRARIGFAGEPGTTVALVWTDEFGTGAFDFALRRNRRAPSLTLAKPSSTAQLTITPTRPMEICGLESAT